MKIKISLPADKEEIRKLKTGDIVYLNGIFYTLRDEGHIRALKMYEKNKKLSIDFKGSAIFHCGPIMKKNIFRMEGYSSRSYNKCKDEFLGAKIHRNFQIMFYHR